MKWSFDNNKPIYFQIIDHISRFIISGELEAGCKLPSVRDMAQDAGVNPNTMQRAFAELEKMELVYSDRTRGRFITEDKAVIKKAGTLKAKETIEEFIKNMEQIGFSIDETIDLLIKQKGDEVNE